MIVIGIDPHKESLTAAAVDVSGDLIAERRFVVNAGTPKQLLKWAQTWPQRRWAVEGAKGLGRGIAQILVAEEESVVDVPAQLTMRVRVLDAGGGRKSDPDDARSVALAALFRKGLHEVRTEDLTTVLRLLSERRYDLTKERTQVVNRLHQMLRELVPGGVPTGLTADKAAVALRRVRPATFTGACRRDLAKELLADLRRVDTNIRNNDTQIRDAVAASRTGLTDIHGVGTVLAAKVLGNVGDIRRFPTADHFASYTGSAPLAASSGERTRHRLNPGGNRQLNAALHIIAVTQIRRESAGRVYYEKKIAEGKSPAEARRALKRRLSASSTARLSTTIGLPNSLHLRILGRLDTQRRYICQACSAESAWAVSAIQSSNGVSALTASRPLLVSA